MLPKSFQTAARTTSLAAIQAQPNPTIYDNAPTTRLGCKCKTVCGTEFSDNCFSTPVCTVTDKNCPKGKASYNWGGLFSSSYYTDYCVFPEYKPYEAHTAAQKAAMVQQMLNSNSQSGHYPSTAELAGIFTESVRTSFDSSSDVFSEPNRKKLIHSVGTVAPIKFVATSGSRYTGLFQGAEHGLVRLSSATAVSSAGFTPGSAFKFFRDGVPSANFGAMPSLDEQACSESNFFAKAFTNHVTGGSGCRSNFSLPSSGKHRCVLRWWASPTWQPKARMVALSLPTSHTT